MAFVPLTPQRYARFTGTAMAREIARGNLSPVQLAEHALALAKAAEPVINAYVCLIEDEARRAAEEREREARAGRLRGPLHGVPIAVKDNFYLAGHPVTRGSRTADGAPASETAPMVERVLAAGAVIIGKTTMPEFGWKGTGTSPLTGITRNPWDPARNPGGSSAGSAATVASGAVPIALGSDAGGSIRIPAAFCGTVGMKPTLGRIPVWPATVTDTLSHVGPLARSAEDARLVVAATSGPDVRDPLSQAGAARAPRDAHDRLRKGRLRIGQVAAPFGCAPETVVAAALETALAALRAKLGADYHDAALDIDLPRAIFETFWVVGRGHFYGALAAARGAEMDPGLVRCTALAKGYDIGAYLAALDARRALNARLAAVFETTDILVMPTMPLTAFAAEDEVPPGGEIDAPLPWLTWTPYTYPFNLSGQPALSLPCGFDAEGLPIGLQIVGAWGADDLVMEVAQRFERVLGRPDAALPA